MSIPNLTFEDFAFFQLAGLNKHQLETLKNFYSNKLSELVLGEPVLKQSLCFTSGMLFGAYASYPSKDQESYSAGYVLASLTTAFGVYTMWKLVHNTPINPFFRAGGIASVGVSAGFWGARVLAPPNIQENLKSSSIALGTLSCAGTFFVGWMYTSTCLQIEKTKDLTAFISRLISESRG